MSETFQPDTHGAAARPDYPKDGARRLDDIMTCAVRRREQICDQPAMVVG